MANTSIFEQAKKLRAKHPKKYSDWTDYVKWAGRLRKKSPAPKHTRKAAKPRRKTVGKLRKAKGIVHCTTVGSVSFHKAQARKQLEEQLAWLLLARDQEKGKRERIKLSKKVALKRQELQKLK